MAAKQKEKKVHIKLEKVSVMQHGHEVCPKCQEFLSDEKFRSFALGIVCAVFILIFVSYIAARE